MEYCAGGGLYDYAFIFLFVSAIAARCTVGVELVRPSGAFKLMIVIVMIASNLVVADCLSAEDLQAVPSLGAASSRGC